jgi:hypothetical protein
VTNKIIGSSHHGFIISFENTIFKFWECIVGCIFNSAGLIITCEIPCIVGTFKMMYLQSRGKKEKYESIKKHIINNQILRKRISKSKSQKEILEYQS